MSGRTDAEGCHARVRAVGRGVLLIWSQPMATVPHNAASVRGERAEAVRALFHYLLRPYLWAAFRIGRGIVWPNWILRSLRIRGPGTSPWDAPEPLVLYSILSLWIYVSMKSPEDSTIKYLLANPASRHAFYFPSPETGHSAVLEARLFTDGALCGKMELLKSPYPRDVAESKVLRFYGPGDSSVEHFDVQQTAGTPMNPHERAFVCTEIVAGSTTGFLSGWRQGPGLVLSSVAYFLPPLGIVVAVAVLVFLPAFTVALGVASLLCVLAIMRGLQVIVRTLRLPRAQAWTPEPLAGRAPILYLLSDTHLCESGTPYEVSLAPALWPAELGVLDTAARFDVLLGAIARATPAPLVIAGDITDRGKIAEWELAADLIELNGLADRTVLLPGNHDLLINPSEAPDFDGHRRRGRFQDYAKIAASFGPTAPVHPDVDWPRTTVLSTDGATVRLILLDSNQYASRWLGSNAIGLVGRSQMRALRDFLAACSEPCIVVLHHHLCDFVGDGRRGLVRAAKNLLMMLADGRALTQLLKRHTQRTGAPVLVLHGHRHILAHYALDERVRIHAHPSSTMGIEHGHTLDGVMRYVRIGFDGVFLAETIEVRQGGEPSAAR